MTTSHDSRKDEESGRHPPDAPAQPLSEEDLYARSIERRAEDLGLPTDPEAYQDGGMAQVATSPNLPNADTLVALLRAKGIPAWVNAPLTTLNVVGDFIFSIVVPAGRLDDALKAVEEARLAHEAAAQDGAEREYDDSPEDAAAEGGKTSHLLIRILYVMAIIVALLVVYNIINAMGLIP